LDQLPIWLSLRARSVLVVGGGEKAAAKIRLALAAGADVTVVAPRLGGEASDLARAQRVRHIAREFAAADLEGRALVYGATGIDAVDTQVSESAKARGVLVNVVDRPALSDFSMPAIIDRSPVVVGVSTGGTVPALAAAVRARVEAALPARLGRLAAFAESFRSGIRAKIANGPARLRFWQGVVSGPIAEQVLAGAEARAHAGVLLALNGADAEHATGTVFLVGAGPGDPELLTLRAVRLLQTADVIVYDRLVGEDVLTYARRDAERVFVGKEPTRHPVSQDEINALLLERARAGLNVVRLKGGDPFIFGRGGEEAEHLRAAGVAVEIVPGITAGLACAAVAGVPLTHRDHAMEVTFVTGHGQEEGAEPDWAALARTRHTLVVYMGVGHAEEIAAKLVAHGLTASMPVAIVQNGTLPGQRVIAATLGRLSAAIAEYGVSNPAVFLIGDVARAAQSDATVAAELVRAVAG
jgi:uroporphyrin-III C-methyltransferase/precorrin-2 dehydrogenase/sirohydrochlorin ferrochelatase